MRQMYRALSVAGASLLLVACQSLQNPPLLFGQKQNVGLSISGSLPEQEAHLDLGYNDRNIAIIPVTVLLADGNKTQLSGYANTTPAPLNQKGIEDTMSVFGQFSLDSGAEPVGAGLDKFFATGIAARILAEGFKARLAQPASSDSE